MKVVYNGCFTDEYGRFFPKEAELSFTEKEIPLFEEICNLLPGCWSDPLSRNVCGTYDELTANVIVSDKEEYRDFVDYYKRAKKIAKRALKG